MQAFKPVVGILRLVALTGFLVSCTHVYKIPVHSVTPYPEQEKVDLKVALQVTEDLRNA
jgi:hypothetical protein